MHIGSTLLHRHFDLRGE
jgi:hypothetical protein